MFWCDVLCVGFEICDGVVSFVIVLVCNEEVDFGLIGGDMFDVLLEVLYVGVDWFVVVCLKNYLFVCKCCVVIVDVVGVLFVFIV